MGKLQFKVGDLRLNEYEIGDRISAALSDADLFQKQIMAYGILENATCPFCNYDNRSDEYDIDISDLVIKEYRPMKDYSLYLKGNEGDYYLKIPGPGQ